MSSCDYPDPSIPCTFSNHSPNHPHKSINQMKATKYSILFAATTLMASITSQAATISWSAFNISAGNGTADVSLDGTLVDARNGASSDVVVNGVTFLSVTNSGNLFDSLFNNDNISGRRGTNPTNAAGSNYASFLQVGQRSGRLGFGVAPRIEPTEVWATVNLSGLTVGNTYQIQIWVSDTNLVLGNAGNTGLLLGNGAAGAPVFGTDTMLLHEVQDGPNTSTYGTGGQYGIGTFVADASTQSFNVRGYNNLLTTPTANNSDHFSNGYQLRDLGVIPEPSTALLGGLGLLALLRRRR